MSRRLILVLLAGLLGGILWLLLLLPVHRPAELQDVGPVGAMAVSPPALNHTSAPKAAPQEQQDTNLAAPHFETVAARPINQPLPVAAVVWPGSGPDTPLVAGLKPVTALANLRTSVRLYCSMFGGNPVGTNPEITRALSGQNPARANFIRPEAGMRINERGELVDPWGTPCFFHQLSAQQMEIRFAGPDHVMWTGDDMVIR